ncbi:MAG: SHOCT domain-containing protein [Solirubrobacteraceae bacterium]
MALGDRKKKAKDAWILVEEIRLRRRAEKEGRTYEDICEEAVRTIVRTGTDHAERFGGSPSQLVPTSGPGSWLPQRYADEVGITVEDLFTRWDFATKTCRGEEVDARLGPLAFRSGEPPTLHGPSPSTGETTTWMLRPGTTASVDAAGSMQVTRGRNLAAKAAGGLLIPGGVFLFGNARKQQHDQRELYLTVSGPGWAETWAIHPDLAAEARRFAALIVASVPVDAPTSLRAGGDVIERLERLQALRESGALTDAEFVTQKARILQD